MILYFHYGEPLQLAQVAVFKTFNSFVAKADGSFKKLEEAVNAVSTRSGALKECKLAFGIMITEILSDLGRPSPTITASGRALTGSSTTV
jgi:hypothetical protein